MARRSPVLPVIAGFLAVSAALRLVGGANDAMAAETAPVEPAPEICLPEEGAGPLLVAFQEREARLAEREAALADRTAALNLLQAEIDENLSALAAAEDSLAAMIALAETAAEEDIARLTVVYEVMKPTDAAALFATMDPDFAAGFLGRMRAEAAAGILANLSPESAYAISAILAGRNANTPTE